VLRDSEIFNRELGPTADSLLAFNDDGSVRAGIDRLRQTTDTLGPAIRFIAPAQTVCNYAGLLARNGASIVAGGNGQGTWLRFIVFESPDGPNNEGGVAAAPANDGSTDPANYLHINPYPNTAAPGQPRECEAGNEEFITGQQVIGNVPGNQGTVTDDQPGEDGP
jgi:hypothetical protein